MMQSELITTNEHIILICKKDIKTKELIKELEKYKCPYCGKIFKKDKKHKKYCSKKCRINAQKDKNLKNTRNYREKNKNVIKTKKELGTKGAYLKQHHNTDHEKEHKSIKNEKWRIGLT